MKLACREDKPAFRKEQLIIHLVRMKEEIFMYICNYATGQDVNFFVEMNSCCSYGAGKWRAGANYTAS